jgi:alpha,alpha-trehalase
MQNKLLFNENTTAIASLLVDIVKNTVPDLDWLKEHLQTVILEYNSVWMVPGERLTVTVK